MRLRHAAGGKRGGRGLSGAAAAAQGGGGAPEGENEKGEPLLPRPRLPNFFGQEAGGKADAGDAGAEEEPLVAMNNKASFPHDARDYLELTLQFIKSSTDGAPKGTLALTRTEDPIDETTLALVVGIGGDTLLSIVNLVQGHVPERPLALDLVSRLLDEGVALAAPKGAKSKRGATSLRLSRVAVVSCVDDVFYGRMYFEDAASGAPLWDCDCRPSDGLWLSMKYDAPFVVHNEVWERCALRLYDLVDEEDLRDMELGEDDLDFDDEDEDEDEDDLTDEELEQVEDFLADLDGAIADINAGTGARARRRRRKKAEANETDAEYYALERIREEDPEAIKRLKMELVVALKEEDYTNAARLRDHPFMQMHQNMLKQLRGGNREEGDFLRRQLLVDIEASEAASSTRPDSGAEADVRTKASDGGAAAAVDANKEKQDEGWC